MSADELLALARQSGVRIATAESCTGGLVAAALTDVSGSSDVFERGFVTYSNAAKVDLLGVPDKMIADHGAVSEEVASAMARGALANSQATLAVSITGVAGPGGSEHKPEGRVCFAIARTGHDPESETHEFGAIGRANVRRASVVIALRLLSDALIQN